MSPHRYLAALAALVLCLALPGVAAAQEAVPTPTAAFTATPVTGATPLLVTFDSSESDVLLDGSYAWDFGVPGVDTDTSTDAAPTFSYTDPGVYVVTLVVTDLRGTSEPATQTITVEAPNLPPTAVATATPSAGTAPLEVVFDGTGSSDSDGAVASYSWDFGVPGDLSDTSTSATPTFTYEQPGTYTATLTVTDDDGASAMTTAVVEVNAAPTADFTWSQDADSLDVTFTDTSTDDGLIASRTWDFGDGATSTEVSPAHTFATPGAHEVKLTVTDDDGGIDQHTATVVVNALPTAGFTWEQDAESLGVTFTDVSDDTDGEIASRLWEFDDGTTSTAASPRHTFATPGPHEVRLTVTDDDGGTASFTDAVAVNAPPTTTFTASRTSGKAPLTVQFNDMSHDSDGTIVTRHWDFGDAPDASDQKSGEDPDYTYATPGSYVARLTVRDDDGGTATHEVAIEVLPQNVAPTTTFTASPPAGDAPLEVTFDDTSADADGSIAARRWDFGTVADPADPSDQRSGADPTFTYDEPGTYTARLVVTDDDGATAEHTETIVVNGLPTASFTAQRQGNAAPLAVHFTDTSTDVLNGTIAAWEWDFGVPGTTADQSSLRNPSYTYQQPGTYTVSLKVLDDAGAPSAVFTRSLRINARPTASFTASSLTGPAPFEPTFTADASDPDGSIASYEWDFGDGTTGSGATASHRYDAVGTYPVTLTVTDDDGARASFAETVTVTLPPEVIEESPAAPTLTKVLTDVLERTPGPCSVRMLTVSALVVCGGNKRSSLNLRTLAVNASPSPVAATITGVEAIPRTRRARKSASPRHARYAARRGTVPALGSVTFVLRPPAKLRRALAARIARRGRVARKPVVTLRAGGSTAVMPHLVTARGKKKRR